MDDPHRQAFAACVKLRTSRLIIGEPDAPVLRPPTDGNDPAQEDETSLIFTLHSRRSVQIARTMPR
jgi:hypothetical protein